MKLLIIRHADPDYENDTITELGHAQAKALAARLAGEGLDRIYSSPLGRARRTAEYTAELLGREIVIESWTRELEGKDLINRGTGPGFAPWAVPGEVIRMNEILPSYDSWRTVQEWNMDAIKKVFDEIKSESDAFIARQGYTRMEGRYAGTSPNSDTIAVFCHGGFGLTWLAHLLAIPLPLMWSGFSLRTTSVTTLLLETRTGEWAVPKCLGLGDQSHLYADKLYSNR
jgi:probable phosphoglycerate mutase